MTGALVVFAKEPRPGAVKTRLCPPFTPEQAAALYAEMLADVLVASAGMARRHGLEPVLAVHPPEAARRLAAAAPRPFRPLGQRGADLAERMEAAVADVAAAGHAPLVLRGSDSPCLREAILGEALAALDDADLAVSPDRDGGYDLVALAGPAPGLFRHEMSTASVLDDTLDRARTLGVRARLVTAGFDVDTARDLARIAAVRDEAEALCPRTLAWLDAHGMWPDPRDPG